MNTEDEADPVDDRVAIRKMAFELADSGFFDDWEAIRVALRSRFHFLHLHQIFASPFCRLDLDQRCWAARTNGSCAGAGQGGREDINSCPLDSRMPAPGCSMACAKRRGHVSRERRKPVTGLTEAIAARLADGRERTADQLAEQLGAALQEVRRALSSMLANGEVHVARTPRSRRGRSARIYAGGPQAVRGGKADRGATSSWPKTDTLVLQAMDALARHR